MSTSAPPPPGSPRGEPLLTVSGVGLDYGATRALDTVSFEVVQGSTTTLVGARKAGKTSLAHLIAGLAKPSRGTIRFRGRDLVGLSNHHIASLGIALVPEKRHHFASMSVRENLELGASLPHARPGSRQRLDRVLALFPRLTAYADIDAGALNLGEQQMVAIGRCLMAAPELILFDEPTRGLSPKLARQLFQLIGTLGAEGMTIILMEQITPAALRLSDSAHVMEHGRIVLSGPGLSLLGDPRG